MKIYLDFVFIMAISVLAAVVDSHVCILKKRPDPSNGGILRWSLLFNERCHCQGVVAPEYRLGQSCVSSHDELDSKLWFTDDPKPLTQRKNWNNEAIDKLLQRFSSCDTEDPVIVSIPENMKTIASDAAGTTVTWVPPTATDNSASQTLTSSHSPGDWFSFGVTSVTYTSTDVAGNSVTGSFTVTVEGTWVVLQRRFNGSVDFYRDWNDYEQGFGSPKGEYWTGLQQIHQLSKTGSWILRVDLEDFDNNTAYAEYESFSIGSATTYYRLSLGSYNGTAGDGLDYSNNFAFTTKDNDNDVCDSRCSEGNCALKRQGAWWYRNCCHANLNGAYLGASGDKSYGMMWKPWRNNASLKRSEMKMRRVQ